MTVNTINSDMSIVVLVCLDVEDEFITTTTTFTIFYNDSFHFAFLFITTASAVKWGRPSGSYHQMFPCAFRELKHTLEKQTDKGYHQSLSIPLDPTQGKNRTGSPILLWRV